MERNLVVALTLATAATGVAAKCADLQLKDVVVNVQPQPLPVVTVPSSKMDVVANPKNDRRVMMITPGKHDFSYDKCGGEASSKITLSTPMVGKMIPGLIKSSEKSQGLVVNFNDLADPRNCPKLDPKIAVGLKGQTLSFKSSSDVAYQVNKATCVFIPFNP